MSAIWALALVHGVSLSLQLWKIYHILWDIPRDSMNSLHSILSWVIVIFIINKFKEIFFIKNHKFYLKKLENIKT